MEHSSKQFDQELIRRFADIVRKVLGEPRETHKGGGEWRYRTRGALRVNVGGDAAGTWEDHENGHKGGVLQFLAEFENLHGPAAWDWLRAEGFAKDEGGGQGGKKHIAATYTYTDEGGTPLCQTVRQANPKKFWQRQPDGNGGWRNGISRPPVRRVLYRLPELIQARAAANGAPWRCYVVEGEKDVDRLRQDWGVTATTNPIGAGKWSDDFDQWLAGADVVIIPDNDVSDPKHPGQTHARAVADSLLRFGKCASVKIVGALRTGDAQDFARDARAAGADGLLLAPVSYTPLTDEEVDQHFVAVADATELPLCIYNNPSTTHFAFSDELVARLAAVPRIVAVKNPAPSAVEARAKVDALRRRVPPGFAVGYSGDWNASKAILAGGVAWYSVLGGLLPRPCIALIRAALAKDEAEVRRIDAVLEPLWELFKQHGSLRVVYAAANLLGLTDAQPPRPILPLGNAEPERIREALERADAASAHNGHQA